MSQFFSKRHASLIPYVPGEQPRDQQYTKLNTNESPFPPSPKVMEAVTGQVGRLQLYCDPDSTLLRQKLAEIYGVRPTQVIVGNGSDEVLNFAFMAYGDEENPMAFPEISYGFYPVFAQLNRIPYTPIPLKADLSLDPKDYMGIGKTIVIANPNAPTGLSLSLAEIEAIVASNPGNVVIIDEAYVDFGGESAVSLVDKYDNLLITMTFSKSRSLAGARLGFGIGSEAIINDLNTIRCSINPYNVNTLTQAAGIAALEENDCYMANCQTIMENRAWVTGQLEQLGFAVIPSLTNFVFARHPGIAGDTLYRMLKERGILVRHFTKAQIADYNRITIGTRAQMEQLVSVTAQILKETAL